MTSNLHIFIRSKLNLSFRTLLINFGNHVKHICYLIFASFFTSQVAIGADHRVVDGATVARFCNEWKLLIEKPELLLLHMR